MFIAAALFAFVMAILPRAPEFEGESGDKILHVLAFATLGALSAAGWRQSSIWLLTACLAAFGALVEIVQLIPILQRDAELLDWFADLAALISAIGASRWILPRLP